MARRFGMGGTSAVGSSKTVLALISSANVRPCLYDILASCGATPADLATIFLIRRYSSTAGTVGSATTILALDPGNPAAIATGGQAYSAEPGYATGFLLRFAMNQRATFRWVASPGSEIMAPATATTGLGLQSESSGGTAIHDATFLWEE